MRIGVNCFLLQKEMGGMRQYFHRLFNELLANDSVNEYVFFYFEHNIVELDHLVDSRWKNNAIKLTCQEEVLDHLDKIDLYFCPFGALWPRPVNIPSVITLPDIQEKYLPEFFSSEDLFNRELYYDPSTRMVDRVIAISEFTKESIVRFHKVSSSKITVAHLCVDPNVSVAALSVEKSLLSLPDKYIFYPANRWLHKNHDMLLRALMLLKSEYGIVADCVLTGFDVANGYPLAEKIREYGLDDRVHVVGYLSPADLHRVYEEARLLCFPSLFEGFGMPVLEAMTLGCPVACSNSTSLPEVAGEAALLFDPLKPGDIAEKIRQLWIDDTLRTRLVSMGKVKAEKFSARRMAEIHKETFAAAFGAFSNGKYYYYKYLYDPIFKRKVYRKYSRPYPS